jgi:hypothetical protein
LAGAVTRTGTDLFSDFDDQAESVCTGQFAVSGFELKTEIRTHIKGFEMCIHSGINHIESPEQDHEQDRIINIPPELIPVKSQGFFTEWLQIGFDF